MGLFDIFKKTKSQPLEGVQKPDSLSQPGKFEVNTTINHFEPKPPTQAELDAKVVPVKTRIKTAIASKHGLYPHEILVLNYAHSFYTSDNDFQRFWWYRYGIRDVQSILSSLVKRGFLQIGDIRATLNKQTVATIKEVLKSHAIKTTGKKAELIQRALDGIPEDELNERFPRRPYSLTDTGQLALDEEAYVIYIHRHPTIEDLDIWSLNRLVHTRPHMPFRDKVWGYLNQRSMKHFAEQNFGEYSSCRFSMGKFLQEENRYKEALGMFAEVALFDVNGLVFNFDPQYAEDFFPYENSLATIPPGVTGEIEDCQEELGYSDEDLKAALRERMSKVSTPLQLFTTDECIEIVFLERDHNTEALEKLYARAKRTFRERYPSIKIG